MLCHSALDKKEKEMKLSLSAKRLFSLKRFYISVLCIINILLLCQIAFPKDINTSDDQLSKGLVGILYDDTNLSRAVSLWYLDKLDSKQVDWEKRNDFSAKWQGMIKAPITGELTFIAEANNGIIMQIDGKTVLNGWDKGLAVQGNIDVVEGQIYTVNLSYRQVSGSSYLRIYWQWEDHPKSIISEDAIWFSTDDESQVQNEYNEALAIPLEELEFDITTIIEIESVDDVHKKRDELISIIFGRSGIPVKTTPDIIEKSIFDQDFESLSNLGRIDKLEMQLEWNLNSIAYHFIPVRSKNKAIIYHQGHRGKFVEGKSTIEAFLAKGFDVVALSMPLKGFNRKPIVSFPRFGKMMIVSHEQMTFLTPSSGHPVRYFLDPVLIMVNYLKSIQFDNIMMIGISGGGWTTTLSAALDTRISKSFPVAGSLPFYLRSRDMHNQSTFGDYEQYAPEIYRVANYLDLYIMGAFGDNRAQLQVLNQYDSCCFDGTGYSTYIDLIKNKMKRLGEGNFEVYLDSSHREHKISDVALEEIFMNIEN
jgi:hypothetical protein